MRIGYNGGGAHRRLDDIVGEAQRAAKDGFAAYWLSQIMGPDSLTALAVVGSAVPGIEVGTSIVPIFGRHPFVLASQALTAQAACRGRLVLGIGTSHQLIVEGVLGESYQRAYTRLEETLDALIPLLAGEAASVDGREVTVHGAVDIEADPPSILVAALGPRSLALAGRRTDGVTLWMVGPRTVAEHVVPRVREAAAAASRPSPRVLAGVPVCVTDDVAQARATAAAKLAIYGHLPAYRAMLEREGFSGPEDLLLAGSAAEIEEKIEIYAGAGVTDMRIAPLCPNEADTEATRDFLRDQCERRNI